MIWIKICGNTNFEDVQCAVDAGANALGFVFAESPRRVRPATVAALSRSIPRSVERFGVFVNASIAEIASTVRQCGLTGVQLHNEDYAGASSTAAALREELRELPGKLGIIQVLHHAATPEFSQRLSALSQNHAIDAALIDSRTAIAAGGTGISFDWRAAQRSFFIAAPHLRVIAAGGLTPENVREAMLTLMPWGLDVVTGVEATPGKKNPDKVRSFITNARAAAVEVSRTAIPVQA